ncbi:MAG: hypothetical protein R3F14_02600 [Polyangiaceae bacterium]
MAEHARDEAWHGVFFAGVFATVWGRMSEGERERFGGVLPELMQAYLGVDLGAVRRELSAVGLSRGEIEAVIGEVYDAESERGSWLVSGAPVMACFRRGGALSGKTVEAFAAARLLERAV